VERPADEAGGETFPGKNLRPTIGGAQLQGTASITLVAMNQTPVAIGRPGVFVLLLVTKPMIEVEMPLAPQSANPV
jgi:hypothetical protein